MFFKGLEIPVWQTIFIESRTIAHIKVIWYGRKTNKWII